MDVLLGLLPLLLMIGIISWIVFRMRKRNTAPKIGPEGQTPYGTYGWLGFFILGLRFLSPLFGAGQTQNAVTDVQDRNPTFYASDDFQTYMAWSWALFLAVVIYQWWLANKLEKAFAPSTVSLVIWSLAGLALALPLLDFAIANASFQYYDLNAVDESIVKSLFTGIFSAAVWITYFKVSKRVKNTYGTWKSPHSVKLISKDDQALIRNKNFIETPPFNEPIVSVSPDLLIGSSLTTATPLASSPSTEEKLRELKQLLENGFITQADYDAGKEKLLKLITG